MATRERTDPRVERTQAHVMEQARRLLVEQGPTGVAFSLLAQEARVSRQTLYRYWDGPEALVADLVTRQVPMDLAPATDARDVLTDFLRKLRTVLQEPYSSVAYGMLIAAATHNPAAAQALVLTVESRRELLNEGLTGLREPLSPDDFSRFLGPLVHAQHFGRRRVDDRFIDELVDHFV